MRNVPKSPMATRFMARNPTYMGTVHGVDLYENPTYGDETTLVAITPDGRVKQTDHWEVPTPADGSDLKEL